MTKKIVHNLSDEKYNLINQENLNNQMYTMETEEKKEINSEPLIPMNSILYDIEIDAEVLLPFIDQNIDLYDSSTTTIKSTNTKQQESLFEPHFDSVVEEKVEPQIKENILATDSHDDKKTQNEYIFNNLDESVLNMDVIDHEIVDFIDQVEIDFNTPISENKYDKQNFSENVSKKIDFNKTTSDVKFEVKSDDESTIETENISFVKTIDETESSESSKRKSHLEKFNHKFSNQYSKIEDLEKEPAYKRKGLKIESSSEQVPSRLSLDNDSNDDLQIRSNNSFLHDNVD